MKKILFIFIIGQLLILSFIFNQNIYPIFELNHLGEASLDSYKVKNPTGSELGELYSQLNEDCLNDNKCNVQIIKMPVSEQNKIIYDVYHSDVTRLSKIKSISNDKVFKYHALNKEEFIDSDGIFYSNLDEDKLQAIVNKIGIIIEPYSIEIQYKEIIKFNALNLIILLILSQLIFFVYTFTRIKINAIKKVLGFSNLKMIATAIKQLTLMQVIIVPIITGIHLIYYIYVNNIVPRYLYLLVLFLIIFCFINLLMMLITQVSIKYIDINLMMKNKLYSNRLNVCLYVIKILLMLSITISISMFILNFKGYKEQLHNYDRLIKLKYYYTSSGFNADEYTKAMNNKDLLSSYGKSVKRIYNHFENLNHLYVHDVTPLLSKLAFLSETQGLTKEDVMPDFKSNYIVVNDTYLRNFVDLKDPKGKPIKLNTNKPTILVPVTFKAHEQEIREFYTSTYNNLLNYNNFYKLGDYTNRSIDQINIIYISNNYKLEMFGKLENNGLSGVELTNTILLIERGEFGSLYYLDQLNHGDLIVKADSRNEFAEQIQSAQLSKLINVGTLITPFLNQIRNTEFIMYHSFVFSILFLITLIFIIYISNYIDVTSNSKKLAYKNVFGYGLIRTLKTRLLISIILIPISLVTFFVPFNLFVYISILILDISILTILYKSVILANIHKIVKGG